MDNQEKGRNTALHQSIDIDIDIDIDCASLPYAFR
jgi:hypothetical protein